MQYVFLSLVFGAIVVGNVAYEAGNISGAALGMEALFGARLNTWYPWGIGVLAFIILWFGSYRLLEKVFVALVLLMSLSFLATAFLTGPDPGALVRGLLIPRMPDGSLLTIMALIGTTVVPYNLFLHASLVREKWTGPQALRAARWDTVLSIGLGGLVSMAIVICAATIPGANVSGVMDLVAGLEPLYGNWARYGMGIGLFAAGITSAITAPLAAAYVASSCFNWKDGMGDRRFRLVWITVLLLGNLSLTLGFHPLGVIQFAQVANGLLLPVVALLLVWVMNSRELLGHHRNSRYQNLLAVGVILIALLLSVKSMVQVLGPG